MSSLEKEYITEAVSLMKESLINKMDAVVANWDTQKTAAINPLIQELLRQAALLVGGAAIHIKSMSPTEFIDVHAELFTLQALDYSNVKLSTALLCLGRC